MTSNDREVMGMRLRIEKDHASFKKLIDDIVITDSKGKNISLDRALEGLINNIVKKAGIGNKLLFIGNGGSASIASHMATDFCKNAGMPALSFNDASLLTCIGNDLGYENVFLKPLEIFTKEGDILFAISSSGRSRNILNGVKAAHEKGAEVVTFSGFGENNPLRRAGYINFYVPSEKYGHVETVHLFLCHTVINMLVNPD